jgi:KUP system potassium uptake protein
MITDTSTVHAPKGRFAALTIAAMGIVYGAIGTSPLYALNQLFFGLAKPQRTPDNVIGGLSLVIWTITIIVAIEYAVFVLRAQNDGEGGLFALYGLLHEYKNRGTRNRGTRVLIWSLMLGAGVLFSDGFITPAISVLSALEGLDVATPAFAASC